MYRKCVSGSRYGAKVQKCAAMRAAKARRRMEQTAAMRDVGGLVTDGCLGAHTVRLLAWPDDTRRLAVVVDGQHRQARTRRGIVRCVAAMIERKTA